MIINMENAMVYALFCFTMVFILLTCLYILVKAFTSLIRTLEIKSKKS